MSTPRSPRPDGSRHDRAQRVSDQEAWHALTAADAAAHARRAARPGVDAAQDVEQRLTRTDRTSCRPSRPPSVWTVARGQATNPMNIMLVIVARGQLRHRPDGDRLRGHRPVSCSTSSWATSQEMKARASVEALAQLQVPQARVRRAGRSREVDVDGARARRRRSARGGRHRSRRRPHRQLRDAGDRRRRRSPARAPPSRRTRARWPPPRRRSATGRTWCFRTPR